jgi:hypothetical protein
LFLGQSFFCVLLLFALSGFVSNVKRENRIQSDTTWTTTSFLCKEMTKLKCSARVVYAKSYCRANSEFYDILGANRAI